jgi:hypothetical protein
VPNYSFENIVHCRCTAGGVDSGFVAPWDSPTSGTPDADNTCIPGGSCHIPFNNWGFQYPNRGNGFVGLGYFGEVGAIHVREYVQVKLLDSLVSGHHYCVSYYVSLGDASMIACNNFDTYFSKSHTFVSTWDVLSLTPQLQYTTIVSDTASWTLISGEITAQGGEQYIIIGNFFSDSLTDTVHVNSCAPHEPFAYYFLDDVSVYPVKNVDAGEDKTTCKGEGVALGLVPNITGVTYHWYPAKGLNDTTAANPIATPDTTTTYYLTQTTPCNTTTDSVRVIVKYCAPPVNYGQLTIPTLLTGEQQFYINALPPNTTLYIYNALGQIVFKTDNYDNRFNTNTLGSGIYFYYLQNSAGNEQRGKVCVIR